MMTGPFELYVRIIREHAKIQLIEAEWRIYALVN